MMKQGKEFDGTAQPSFLRRKGGDETVVKIPEGHIGPLVLSETGRMIYWTGRVAIGLRHRPLGQNCGETLSINASWIQRLLLKSKPRARADHLTALAA